MKKSFATLDAPVLASVIRERTPRAACAAIRKGELHGATAFDLHLSCFDPEFRNEEAFRTVISSTDRPVLALNYNQDICYNGFETTEEERIGLLKLAAGAGASAVDLQGYSLDLPSKTAYRGDPALPFAASRPLEVVTDPAVISAQTKLIDSFHDSGVEVLLSTHPGTVMSADEVVALAEFLEPRKPDILKIVTRADTEAQAVESMRAVLLLKEKIKTCKVSYHCFGKGGRITRIVNPLLGSYLAFCTDGYSSSSLLDQPDLQTAADLFAAFKRML